MPYLDDPCTKAYEKDLVEWIVKKSLDKFKAKGESFFTPDLVEEVLRHPDYIEIGEKFLKTEEIYEICEDAFMTAGWAWTYDWVDGPAFGPSGKAWL